MIKYVYFLTRQLSHKIFLYLVPLLTAILMFFINKTLIKDLGFNGGMSTFGIAMLNFILAIVFSILTIAHVFKEGEEDGSELMVVAKPLTRIEIILGKFLTVLLMIIGYQIIMLLSYALTMSTIDVKDDITTSLKTKWVWSQFIGGFIIQIIASSLIIILSSVLGKVKTIVVGILLTAIFPIASMITQLIGGGMNDRTLGRRLISYNVSDTNDDIKWDDNIYLDQNFIIGSEDAKADDLKDFDDYQDKLWYDTVSYFDVFYHWSRFYEVFMGDYGTLGDNAKLEKVSTNIDISKDPNHFTVADENLIYLYNYSPNSNREDVENTLTRIKNDALDIASGIKGNTIFKDILTAAQFNNVDMTFVKQLSIISAYKSRQNRFDEISRNTSNEFGNAAEQKTAMINTIEDFISNYTIHDDIDNSIYFIYQLIANDPSVTLATPSKLSDPNETFKLQEFNIYTNDDFEYKIVSKPFVSTSAVIIIWIILGIALLGGSIWIYMRRDFK